MEQANQEAEEEDGQVLSAHRWMEAVRFRRGGREGERRRCADGLQWVGGSGRCTLWFLVTWEQSSSLVMAGEQARSLVMAREQARSLVRV